MQISITRANPDDAAEVVAIADECRLSYWSAEDYAKEASRPNSAFFAIRTVDERIEGFLAGRFTPAQNSDIGVDFELYNIGIRPEKRELGLGSALMNALINECVDKNVSKIWLEVRVSNLAARRFYESFGFTSAATRPGLYIDPAEDGILMTLLLNDRKR